MPSSTIRQLPAPAARPAGPCARAYSPEREPDARSGHRLPTAVPGGHTEGARCQLAGSPRPRHTEHLEAIPMQRLHRTVRALRRLGARLHTWRDEIAARPVDPDGWWR
ncbi:hypothetical protein GCM10009635_48900 [Actinocatenispora thailandica]